MKKRQKSLREECPVARSLEVVGDRWSLLIIRNAFDGIRRFGEFQKDLGLSKSVLASRLHALVLNGILHVEPAADGSAYQEYGLTEKGRGLFHVVVGLRQWGEAFLFSQNEEHSVMVDRSSQESVHILELRSQHGKLLTPNDVVVKKVRARESSRSKIPG
jgi:DNA-binding HxlR family transcriptional regulator